MIKLPINTMVNVHIDDIRKIGYGCGVYVLITRSGETYVGSSINIKRRVSHHRNNRELGRIESVIIFATANIREAKDLEMTIIKEIKPDLNRYLYTSTVYKLKDVIRSFFRYSMNWFSKKNM